MYLTNAEHEAFIRGQAAGLIPVDLPLPENDQEINELIYHVGILESAKIGYRDINGKLRVMELTAFTSKHLDVLTANAMFRLNSYPNWLEGLYNYFSYGSQIVTADDLAGRLSLHNEKISVEQVLKGFELEYTPIIRTGPATLRQKATLVEMILAGRLPMIPRRQWENLTKEEASWFISSVPKPKAGLPESLTIILDAIDGLNPEEKNIVTQIINQKSKWRITA